MINFFKKISFESWMHGYPINDSCSVGAGFSVHSLGYLAILTKQICSCIVWLWLKSFSKEQWHTCCCAQTELFCSHCTISFNPSVYSLWHYTYTLSLFKEGLMNILKNLIEIADIQSLFFRRDSYCVTTFMTWLI